MFHKENEQTVLPSERTRTGKTASIIGILCNLVLFAGKLLAGIISGSLSITADAINNLSDASASVITLFGFKVAEKPADEDHPYGHGRSEYIAGMVVAAMILFIGFEVAKTAVSRMLKPADVTFSVLTVVILMISIFLKLWLAIFYRNQGKTINSATLYAASVDSRNDVLTTAAVLVAMILEHIVGWKLDGYISFLVAVFILYSGVKMVKETVDPLLGRAGSMELRKAVAALVSEKDKVLGYHDLLVHDYGPNQCFASIHVELDYREEPMHCHDILDEIERECLDKLKVHLVIHYDPIITDDAGLVELRKHVQKILCEYDDRLLLHDFRVAEGKEERKLIFDIARPDRLQKEEDKIREFLDRELSNIDEHTYCTVITFDPMA